MAEQYKWIIWTVAQVDAGGGDDWEYKHFEKIIKSNYKPDGSLSYFIFYFDQNEVEPPRIKKAELVNGKVELTDVEGSKPGSIFDGAAYKEFFKNKQKEEEKLKQNYPGDTVKIRHMLITWGHGSGLEFFHFDNNTANTSTKTRNNLLYQLDRLSNQPGGKKNLELRKLIRFIRQNKSFNGKNVLYNLHCANLSWDKLISKLDDLRLGKADSEIRSLIEKNPAFKELFDKRTQNLLTVNELKEILKTNFSNTKIDLFVANNCWVNMFEVGYELRNQVTMFAAPQTIVPFAGIDYNRLFATLQRNPGIKPKYLAQNITDNYAPKYVPKSEKGTDFANQYREKRRGVDTRQLSLSVNLLQKYGKDEDGNNQMVGSINKLCNYIIAKLKDPTISNPEKRKFLQRIDIARSYCGDLTQQGANYIDFTSFFTELIKSFQDENPGELKQIYQEFFCWKDKALLSILNPGDLFRFMPEYFYSQSPQMFSIYFPPRIGRTRTINEFLENEYLNETKKDSDFKKDCQWIDFLRTYLFEADELLK